MSVLNDLVAFVPALVKNPKAAYKALLAFASLFATNVATDLMQHAVAWPTNGGEWARFALTTLAGTFAVWEQKNAAA